MAAIVVLAVIGCGFAWWTSRIAGRKGRRRGRWAIAGFFFGLLAVAAAAWVHDLTPWTGE